METSWASHGKGELLDWAGMKRREEGAQRSGKHTSTTRASKLRACTHTTGPRHGDLFLSPIGLTEAFLATQHVNVDHGYC